MKIYNYDENKKYLRESIARENPMDPNCYLLPKNATFIQVLEHKPNFDIYFIDGKWEYKEPILIDEVTKESVNKSTLLLKDIQEVELLKIRPMSEILSSIATEEEKIFSFAKLDNLEEQLKLLRLELIQALQDESSI